MASPTSRPIVPAGAVLVGTGDNSCTNQEPAPGDRWCAFRKPGNALGFYELWVINVSKAAAIANTPGGTPIKCDTTDANCLRLSTALYEDPNSGYDLNEFDGDTLIYYEEPSAGQDGFVGVVRAWRPGWTTSRKLTKSTGLACAGHRTSASVICIENLDGTATTTTVDLHAGFVTDPAGGVLPKVDTMLTWAMGDGDTDQKWHLDLNPDGQSVAWSSRAVPTGPEILRVQKIGDDASRKVVTENVSEWTISPDGASWLWLKNFSEATRGSPSGTLEAAAFPDGSGVKTLAENVGEYRAAGAKSIVYRTKMKDFLGDLMLMPSRDTPATVSMLDQGVAFVFDFAKDGARVVYTKNVEALDSLQATVFDLYGVANDGKRPCTMVSTPIAVLQPELNESGEVAAWGRINAPKPSDVELEGVYTNFTTCTTKKFAPDVVSWTTIGNQGYVFLDDAPLDSAVNEATLRYSKLDNGTLPAQGVSIQTRAQFTYATLLPTLPAVVYEVNSGTSVDGLYINATLPFTTTPVVPPPDGGAPDAPDGGETDGSVDAPADGG